MWTPELHTTETGVEKPPIWAMGYRGIRHRSQPIIPIFLKTLTLICQAWVWAQQSILFGVFLISLCGSQLQNPQWTLPSVYRSLSWSEKRKTVYRMKYLTRGRAVSSHTSVKCDATALIHECVELRCLFITFPTHLQRERMKLCMSKSPLQISKTKLASLFPCASLAQFCNSSPDIRQLEFTFFSGAIDREVSPALRLAEILY